MIGGPGDVSSTAGTGALGASEAMQKGLKAMYQRIIDSQNTVNEIGKRFKNNPTIDNAKKFESALGDLKNAIESYKKAGEISANIGSFIDQISKLP
jgi:uncharacterized protein YaaR (DUF327 family)